MTKVELIEAKWTQENFSSKQSEPKQQETIKSN